MNVYEKGDQSFGNKLLAHVEDNKYDWVMKICRENLYGTAEGSQVEFERKSESSKMIFRSAMIWQKSWFSLLIHSAIKLFII